MQFEFNSTLLDAIYSASAHLLEGKLTGVNQELDNAQTLLNTRNKAIRFADKSPAGWYAVEEYESDELEDNSEDEKKLRSAERMALTKIRSKKQNRNSSQSWPKFSHEASFAVGSFFRPQQQTFR